MSRHYSVMPEEHALRSFHWQFFLTLTFRGQFPRRDYCMDRFHLWLRRVVQRVPQLFFPRVMWVVRYETGASGQRGHLHACLAGLPPHTLSDSFCRSAEAIWHRTSGARSEISIYDRARNGVAYVLKVSADFQHLTDAGRSSAQKSDEQVPMLSDSLMDALRRRM
jgi:hypothetical protein